MIFIFILTILIENDIITECKDACMAYTVTFSDGDEYYEDNDKRRKIKGKCTTEEYGYYFFVFSIKVSKIQMKRLIVTLNKVLENLNIIKL